MAELLPPRLAGRAAAVKSHASEAEGCRSAPAGGRAELDALPGRGDGAAGSHAPGTGTSRWHSAAGGGKAAACSDAPRSVAEEPEEPCGAGRSSHPLLPGKALGKRDGSEEQARDASAFRGTERCRAGGAPGRRASPSEQNFPPPR